MEFGPSFDIVSSGLNWDFRLLRILRNQLYLRRTYLTNTVKDLFIHDTTYPLCNKIVSETVWISK